MFIRSAGMNIHHVESGADGIGEPTRSRSLLKFIHDILLSHSSSGEHTPGLADVRILGHAILTSHDIGAQREFRIAFTRVVIARERRF